MTTSGVLNTIFGVVAVVVVFICDVCVDNPNA